MRVRTHVVMEENKDVGGAAGGGAALSSDASVGAGAAAPVLEKGRAEVPDFAAIADSSDDLIPEDDTSVTDTGTGAKPAEVKAAPAAAAPPAAAAIAPTPPASAPVPPVTTPAAPATPPAVAEPPKPADTAAKPPAAEQPITLEQHREKALPELAKLYTLTSEEAESLRVSPETALPQLAAKLHFEVVMSTYNAVMSQLPQMLGGVMTHERAVQDANNKFFEKWGDLKAPEHLERVRSSIRAYKTANPNATMDEVIQGAGALAMISLGLPVTGAAPAAPTQTPVVAAAPARPAGIGAGGAPIATPRGAVAADDVASLVEAELAGHLD